MTRACGIRCSILCLALALPLAAAGADDATRCRLAIVREGAGSFVGQSAALQRCHSTLLGRSLPGEICPTSDVHGQLDKITDRTSGNTDGACADPIPGSFLCQSLAAGESLDLADGLYAGLLVPEPDRARRGCRRAIGREGVRFAKVKAKALRDCNLGTLKGKAGFGPLGTTCDSPQGTQALIADAETRKQTRILDACTSLDPQDDLGFPTTCPGLPYCSDPIPTLADLVTCADCIAEAEVDQLIQGLVALPLAPLDGCLLVIGRETRDFSDKVVRELFDCYDDVLRGVRTPPCPDTETQDDIDNARTASVDQIMTACSTPPPDLAARIAAMDTFVTGTAPPFVAAFYPFAQEELDLAKRTCRREIGNSGTDAGRTHLTRLRSCESLIRCDQIAGPCPNSETQQAITRSDQRRDAHILADCTAYTPQGLGFAAQCPALFGCETNPTTTLAELLACFDCLDDGFAQAAIAVGFPP